MTYTNYPYEINLEVAFRDIDAMGHVNNAVFFAYFETVRIKYLGDIMEKSGLFGTELLDLPLILVEAAPSRSPTACASTSRYTRTAGIRPGIHNRRPDTGRQA